MNLPMKQKQTHRHREQTCGCQGRGEQGREGWGVQNQQWQTNIQRMDKQQGPTVLHRDIQYPVINHNGKEYEKEYIYICITESLCCTAEINTL